MNDGATDADRSGAAIDGAVDAVMPEPEPEPAAARPGSVAGFRSAHFGMSEAQVIEAVEADFGKDSAAIRQGETLLEKTRQLSVVVDDLLPGSGPARVTYTLGYASQALNAVEVQWGGTDGAPPPEVLQAAGALLLDYFNDQPYAQTTIDRMTAAGDLIAFIGRDEMGRSVALTLGKALIEDGDATAAQRFVRVRYEQDDANPDVFQIKPGQF